MLVRVGQFPKRAIPLRTDEPFRKIVRKLTAPDGSTHKIEVLGDGQQVAVAGLHPDTNRPFAWRGGRSPVNTPREALPLVTETEVIALLDLCAEQLCTKLGWRAEAAAAPAATDDMTPYVPMEKRIELTQYQGEHSLNQSYLELAMSRLDCDMAAAVVIEECMALALRVWEQISDTDEAPRPQWDWNKQRRQAEDCVLGHIKKKVAEHPRLAAGLPDHLRKKWEDIVAHGGSPILAKKRFWYVTDSGPAPEIPIVDDIPTTPPREAPRSAEEKKLRFRLISFQDMRPGLEPSYLIDELMPSAGLVLVWGRQKTFKSFWLLDLFVHVAMGWPYRDHAVRQGLVIYCAFEGGHGYKGRIEAIRRHYGIGDEVDVPLYVMPGQVDLIKDAKALVSEFQEQLVGEIPAVVVLDTLNRSLSGSESSDKDMTDYVKAAEAIRKAFGCVCVIVHHCGYDDTHARGHTSLPAAVDAELSVERDIGSPVLLVSVKQMRDGPEGMQVRSRAQSVPLDPDQNGKPRSSIVIVPEDGEHVVIPGRHGRPDMATPLLVEAVRAAIDAKGEYFVPDGKLPLQAVEQQHVREIFYRRYIDAEADAKKSENAQKKGFRRALENAVAKELVNGQKDDKGRQLLWLVRDEGVPVE
jgi:hypothetical protein